MLDVDPVKVLCVGLTKNDLQHTIQHNGPYTLIQTPIGVSDDGDATQIIGDATQIQSRAIMATTIQCNHSSWTYKMRPAKCVSLVRLLEPSQHQTLTCALDILWFR
jgi:hypothetical protein